MNKLFRSLFLFLLLKSAKYIILFTVFFVAVVVGFILFIAGCFWWCIAISIFVVAIIYIWSKSLLILVRICMSQMSIRKRVYKCKFQRLRVKNKRENIVKAFPHAFLLIHLLHVLV